MDYGEHWDVTLVLLHTMEFKAKIFWFSYSFIACTLGRKKKTNRNTPIYFSTYYRTEMKLVSIIMGYCLLQVDALKFFLGVRIHGESKPNFNFFNVNPQNFQRNRKVHLTNRLETNFHDISIISLRVIRRRNYS